MKIFLTGATGFIGSHATRSLIHAGHEVYALVRPESNRSRIADLPLHFIEGNLLTGDFTIPKVDCCVHLAWYVEPGKYLDSPLNRDYLHASLALAQRGFPRFVGAGTCFESHSRTAYAAAKLKLLAALDSQATWVRIHYQYGPFEDPRRFVPSVIHALRRGQPVPLIPGDRVRDHLHVADVGSAIAAVVASPLTGVVDIGSGVSTTHREIGIILGALLGQPDLLQFGARAYRLDEPGDIIADPIRLRSTGWKPRYDLETGLRATVDWWAAQP